LAALIVVLAAPLWLPVFGTALAIHEEVQTADVALVLEGTGKDALDAAESWRKLGTVHAVVVVEAPVKTHALVAYWTDFINWRLASPAATPPEYLRVARAVSTQAAEQARAALVPLRELQARSVLVPGGGGIGSRLVEREVESVLSPAGIHVRIVRHGEGGRDPARWYQNAEDRRAVLDTWLQLLVPFLSAYEPAGS
jgi:hypothetical protein